MATGRQATFGNVEIETGTFRQSCTKVKGVYNGEKEICGKQAKYRIERPNGEREYRCGLHKTDVKVLLEGDL